ncbi:MAG: hypothetical protein NC223_07785 [Butyrivibrio sp.]|nr:hypothetical protein [Butyrivibrio sp.]
MKKTTLIAAVLMLLLTFAGCTKSSSTLNAENNTSEASSSAMETETETEKYAEKPSDEETTAENTTEEPTTEAPSENQEDDYNAEEARKNFEESDIPDSIKNVFLSDGEFIDTQTQKEMKLGDYKLYYSDMEAETYDFNDCKEVFNLQSYIAVDFDGDGKKELFYDVNNGTDGVIFHEHTDGKVYAYRHSSLRVHIGENGDVVGSGGFALTSSTLYRYSFDTEKLIRTVIAYARQQEDGEYKYYAEGREVEPAEFETYFKLLSEGSLNWTKFSVMPNYDSIAENAKKVLEESDIPSSIKNIFLSDGEFVDTQTMTTVTLQDYKVYEKNLIYDSVDAIPREEYNLQNGESVEEWMEYVSVDFDNDGKKELFFVCLSGLIYEEGVIFHEHTDGKVYAYRHQSIRISIGENGDVAGPDGAYLSEKTVERYSFDTEKIVKTKIAYAEFIANGRYKYFVEGNEVDYAEFGKYLDLLSEGSLDFTKFGIIPTK